VHNKQVVEETILARSVGKTVYHLLLVVSIFPPIVLTNHAHKFVAGYGGHWLLMKVFFFFFFENEWFFSVFSQNNL
jgi:hypothetical protein